MKVIYIIADTFRRDHVGAYGCAWIHTPNLDRLASRSAVFEKAYIGSFPTVPYRRDVALGCADKGLPFNRWKMIDPDEVTVPARLAEKKIPSMLITDTQNTVTRGINLYRDFTAWTLNRGQEGDPHWMDANVDLEFPVPHHLIRYTAERWLQILTNRAHRVVETDWFAPGTYEIALRWLERNYKRDDFLLWLETFDPHEPWDPPQHYIDLYDPDYKGRVFDAPTYGLRKKMGVTDRELKHIRARYAAEVTMVDACVGKLLAALERLGILDETLLIFTSDHGTMFDEPGDHGRICKPTTVGADGMCMSAGRPPKEPVQHFPISTHVARVPLFIKPPHMKKGRRIRQITQPWDISATLLDAFGIPKPENCLGDSLLPLAAGEKRKGRNAAVFGSPILAEVMTDRWLYAAWRGQRDPVLFDLQNDPRAEKNLVATEKSVARRLKACAVAFMRRQHLSDEFIDGYDWGL